MGKGGFGKTWDEYDQNTLYTIQKRFFLNLGINNFKCSHAKNSLFNKLYQTSKK